MKILFTSRKPSDQNKFYVDMLSGLNHLDNIQFQAYAEDYENFDVILIMYWDCHYLIDEIRTRNKKCKIGVVDPRIMDEHTTKGDFVIVQGLEEEDMASDYYPDVFRYDFHPVNPCMMKQHYDKNKIIVGTHGNKIHLHTMYPYLSSAIEALARDFDVEFRAYYNIKEYGNVDFDLFPAGNVEFKEVQWSWDIFQKGLPDVDIGVVPNLIPIKNIKLAKKSIQSYPALFNEDDSNNLVRYKATSNIGRLYPFAQLGIPVVADMYPSSCNTIESGVTGYFGGSAGLWYRSLHKLASSAELRQRIGRNMQKKYLLTASQEVFNKGLVDFLQEVCSHQKRRMPENFPEVNKLLSDSTILKANKQKLKVKTIMDRLSVVKGKFLSGSQR